MEIHNVNAQRPVTDSLAVPQRPASWKAKFAFRGKQYFYNRIPYNNRAERAVEIPLAFAFLARQPESTSILEVGNVLRYYENALSDTLGIRSRRIVDKFEVGDGIENVDIMDLDSAQKYQAIACISTVEHVGQSFAPTGRFGERQNTTDLEAPLKAIAKIYDLLEIGGEALITVPFGVLSDGGWYVQFSAEYLELLVSKYGIPAQVLSVGYLKRAFVGPGWINPLQWWEEATAEELRYVRYDLLRGGARAIAVIELKKAKQPFTLNLAIDPSPLTYLRSHISRSASLAAGLLCSWF
ncbi:hypothetical protein EPA93_19705 [Ktedonosporobacter rubrisoli]|uniref:Class I SAM-dependent methyltransferase n=1 Tax=Ktedonosporobacter rubrisoli TaxID=2509675 RepID=A0A4P6JSA8_KTERU|nr:hypothetical protein [Ktedonosporobacter rubrisoli]QBD78100.1 hypothetical protein EPA93_19705 [Ktedonosporobacter rubrisoli]